MNSTNKNILLFNPWIYDFAAYDFWNKPLGLLSVGAFLRRHGYEVHLVDCLDRHHPKLLRFLNIDRAATKTDGTGKFYRQEIEKPAVYKNIPRKYCRYGMPPSVVKELLQDMPEPAAILVTSFMTYWYPALRDAIKLLRETFPGVPILVGGTYATLLPEHARRTVAPDYLVRGEGEIQTLGILSRITGNNFEKPDMQPLDALPFAALDLYPNLQSVAILSSRGCPFRCSFCASAQLTEKYRRRSPAHVIEEMRLWYQQFRVRHFAFFDDALLHNSDQYWKPILRLVKEHLPFARLHTPNGIHVRYIREDMAQLMHDAGVTTIRLSFESSNPARQKWMSHKVSNADLERALANLEQAGYKRHDIGVYVLMGLPDQDMQEVRDSVNYVTDLGARVNLASFSPIPNTLEWDKTLQAGFSFNDPLQTNNSVFPVWSQKYGYQTCQELVLWTKDKNLQLLEKHEILQ